jgi:hypothetical protein
MDLNIFGDVQFAVFGQLRITPKCDHVKVAA